MQILIINGNPQHGDESFDSRLDRLGQALRGRGKNVEQLALREMEIGQCIGCFACWVKSPGRCVIKDDQEKVLRGVVAADLVIMASPLIMGFTSALLKRSTERLVPLLLPFIDASSGESRHFLRYGASPLLGVVYAPEADTDPEDVEISAGIWRRMARNFGSRIAFFKSILDPAEEVCHEVCSH